MYDYYIKNNYILLSKMLMSALNTNIHLDLYSVASNNAFKVNDYGTLLQIYC